MLLLAYRNLRARPVRTLLTALAIALGVGMIFAMRLVGATVNESARLARESRLAGADLEVTSAASAKIPLSLLETLDARPEVELAAPIYRGQEGAVEGNVTFAMGGTALQGTGLSLLGVAPARTLSPYELAAGDFFGQDLQSLEVLLPSDWAALHGLGLGSKVSLTTGQQTHEYNVVGLLKAKRELTSAGGRLTAWLSLDTLNAAFDAPGTATAILIRLKPNAQTETTRAELQASLGTQYIVTSASGSAGLNSLYSITTLALPVAGFAILLAGSFLVFNAFAITLAERRREIGQLRTLGMTRGQVLAQTLAEATLTALLGSAIGLLLGWALGRGVTAAIQVFNGNASVPNAPIPADALPLAVGAGVLVTLTVTFGLAHAASRVSPLAAMQTEQAAESKRGLMVRLISSGGLGLLLLSATVVFYFQALAFARTSSTPSYGPIFLPVLTFGAAVVAFLPLWVNGAIALWGWIARRLKGAGVAAQLAASSLGRQRTRAALTTATLVISFMLVIALTGLTLFMSEFLLSFNLSIFSGQIALVRPFPPGTSLAESAGLPSLPAMSPGLQADIDSLSDQATIEYFANVSIPGVGVQSGFGDQYAFAMDVSIIRDKRMFPVAEGSWDEAERYFAEHEPAILLPELTARKLNKHPGDTLEIDTLKGKVPFTVALVGGGFPVVSPKTGAEYFGSYPFGILFTEKPGVSREALQARVDKLVERHRTEVGKLDASALTNVVGQLIGPIQGLFAGLTSLSGIVAALGIVVTLFASVLERQREMGTLRALGMSRATVRGLIVLEAGLLGLVGSTLGVVGGLGMAWLFGQLMNAAVALMSGVAPMETVPVPWLLAGASVVIGPVIAMLAALYPADRAANVNPAEAMRAEGATGFLPPAKHLGPTGLRGLIAHLPLSAKLSLGIGVVFVLTLVSLTTLRANYERRLLEDNIRTLMGRMMDTSMEINRDQVPAQITELTPQILATLQQQAGAQAEALQAQFQAGSEYEFTPKYLFVTDSDLKVIYSDRPEFFGRVLTNTVPLNSSASEVRVTDWTGERVFEAVGPIENQAGKRVGIFQIGFSTAPVDNFIRDIVVSSVWTMYAALAVAVTITVLFTRRALAPIAQIAEASDAVARGDLTQRVPETRWDEVGRLARSFNEMVRGLNDRERMRQELSLAREIQHTLLPKALPALPGWHLAAHYQPAREVGGDFYDFIPLPDDRLGLVIGDVSGKGIPAALVMATARSLLRACALDGAAPGHVLARVNDLLHPDIPPNMFVTCLYAVLDPGSGHLQFANAGHDLPYQRRADGVTELRARGMPLGALPAMRYEEQAIQLAPGDWVLFYTDGLVEAHNARREMFGFPRLKALLEGHRSSGAALIPMLLDELRRFTGRREEQEDDVALVILQRTAIPFPKSAT